MSDEKPLFPMETYTLTFTHEMIDTDGNRHQLEKPIQARQIVTHEYDVNPSIIMNDMLERMEWFLLSQVREGK